MKTATAIDRYIGTVSIPTGVLSIADPCHGGDPDRAVRVSVRAGDHELYAYREDGGRVMALSLAFEDREDNAHYEIVVIGEFSIDSGTVILSDVNQPAQVVISSTGYGAGTYVAFAHMREGRVCAVIIDFRPLLDDGDDDGERH